MKIPLQKNLWLWLIIATLCSFQSFADTKLEAEDAQKTGVTVQNTTPGYSGSGYVSFANAPDRLKFSFNVPAGLYNLNIRFNSPFSQKGYDMWVNGTSANGMFPHTPNGFDTFFAGKFVLKEGQTTIEFGNGWGYFNIDYIVLSPAGITPPPVKPPKTLVDAAASKKTCALHSYLVDIYGSKVLSGQMSGQTEVSYIEQKTGKTPAVVAFDLMDYSPSRIEHSSYPTGHTENFINWSKSGNGRGILSVMWHWNAPTKLLNQDPDKLWWRGFYTDASTFDLAAALADKNGYDYQRIIYDIDAIAVELKKLSDANIPVLWRPLHEAHGGWFWWGAKGAGPFKELWNILFDRLTYHHNLHNLIWVYTGDTDMNWYPGDDKVDMIGLDIYNSSLAPQWQQFQDVFSGRKLVSLSESDKLPLPTDDIHYQGTWWSFFALWGGDYLFNQPQDLLTSVFNDEKVITRDELPDWTTYCGGGTFTDISWMEAEKAILNGVNEATTTGGYSGTGYVEGFDEPNDNIIFNFNATAGAYNLVIHYTSPFSEKGVDITINGATTSPIFPVSGNNFTAFNAGQITLKEGANTLSIGGGWGWYFIDYISLNSVVTGVSSLDTYGLEIFPNPSTDEFHIQSQRPIANIEVMNMLGIAMETVSPTGNDIHFGQDLNEGIYLVKIGYENGESKVVKLVKK